MAAIYVAVSPLLEGGPGGSHGYVLTTVGLTAIFFGIRAIRRNRIVPSFGITASAMTGIGLGAIVSLAMVAVMATAHTAPGGGSGLAVGPGSSFNGLGTGAAAGATQVTLSSLAVVGSGEGRVFVGNGGSVRLDAGYSIRSAVANPRIDVRLERRLSGGDWTTTGVTAPTPGVRAPLTVRTPPYSTSAATETVEYRLASRTSSSSPVRVVYENQRAYTGMAATMYGYASPYCPATAVHIADLAAREAGEYDTGALLIQVDSKVGGTVNLPPEYQRTVALHECSHELQWLNYGESIEGHKQMEAAAAKYFTEGSNGAKPIEHAADCGALALEPNGYLGYGGYCTRTELAEGRKLLSGQRY